MKKIAFLKEVLNAQKKLKAVGVNSEISPSCQLKDGNLEFGLKGSLSYGQDTEDSFKCEFSVTGDVQEGVKKAFETYFLQTVPFHHLNAEGRKAYFAQTAKTASDYEFEFSITEFKVAFKGGRYTGKAAMSFSVKGPKLNCEGSFSADIDISLEKYFAVLSDVAGVTLWTKEN